MTEKYGFVQKWMKKKSRISNVLRKKRFLSNHCGMREFFLFLWETYGVVDDGTFDMWSSENNLQ